MTQLTHVSRPVAAEQSRFRLGAGLWVIVSSVPLAVFGLWISFAAPELWKKFVALPNALHAGIVLWALISRKIEKKWYQMSSLLLLSVWFAGSLDHGLISVLEWILLGLGCGDLHTGSCASVCSW